MIEYIFYHLFIILWKKSSIQYFILFLVLLFDIYFHMHQWIIIQNYYMETVDCQKIVEQLLLQMLLHIKIVNFLLMILLNQLTEIVVKMDIHGI